MAGSMPQASPKSGPVSGSRVSTVTVARGPGHGDGDLAPSSPGVEEPADRTVDRGREWRARASRTGARLPRRAPARGTHCERPTRPRPATSAPHGRSRRAGPRRAGRCRRRAGSGARRSRTAKPPSAAGRRRLRTTAGSSAPGLSGQRTRSAPSVDVAASSMARLGVSPAPRAGRCRAAGRGRRRRALPADDEVATGGRGRPDPAATGSVPGASLSPSEDPSAPGRDRRAARPRAPTPGPRRTVEFKAPTGPHEHGQTEQGRRDHPRLTRRSRRLPHRRGRPGRPAGSNPGRPALTAGSGWGRGQRAHEPVRPASAPARGWLPARGRAVRARSPARAGLRAPATPDRSGAAGPGRPTRARARCRGRRRGGRAPRPRRRAGPPRSRVTCTTTSMAAASWARTASGARPGQGAQRLEPGDDIGGSVGVHRAAPALVAGVERCEQLPDLGATHLAHDDPVGAHAQRLAHQRRERDLADALDVGRTRLEPHQVRVVDRQLAHVLDDEQALDRVDAAEQRREERRLARSRAARDDEREPPRDQRHAARAPTREAASHGRRARPATPAPAAAPGS